MWFGVPVPSTAGSQGRGLFCIPWSFPSQDISGSVWFDADQGLFPPGIYYFMHLLEMVELQKAVCRQDLSLCTKISLSPSSGAPFVRHGH